MSNFFERLREERERLGLTQTELGEAGGVRKEAQSNYETGKRSPDSEYLAKIATCGVDVKYVLTGERSVNIREQGVVYQANPRLAAIIEMASSLDSDGLDHVQDAAEMAKQVLELKTQVKDLQNRKAG